VVSERIVTTSTSTLAPDPIPTPGQVRPVTATPSPTKPTSFVPTSTVPHSANTATEMAHLEQIKSGGMAQISLWPTTVDLMLTDAQGRRLGYDPVSGQEVNEFADGQTNYSSYTPKAGSEGNYSRVILLTPVQAWGTTITFTITGLEPGDYQLLGIFNDGYLDHFPKFLFRGTIKAGEIQTRTVYIPPTLLEFPVPQK